MLALANCNRQYAFDAHQLCGCGSAEYWELLVSNIHMTGEGYRPAKIDEEKSRKFFFCRRAPMKLVILTWFNSAMVCRRRFGAGRCSTANSIGQLERPPKADIRSRSANDDRGLGPAVYL
jgi:hypothetical protein